MKGCGRNWGRNAIGACLTRRSAYTIPFAASLLRYRLCALFRTTCSFDEINQGRFRWQLHRHSSDINPERIPIGLEPEGPTLLGMVLHFVWRWLCTLSTKQSRFLSVYNPTVIALRAKRPWLPFPIFTFGVWLAGLVAAVVLLLCLSVLVAAALAGCGPWASSSPSSCSRMAWVMSWDNLWSHVGIHLVSPTYAGFYSSRLWWRLQSTCSARYETGKDKRMKEGRNGGFNAAIVGSMGMNGG